MKKLDVVTLPVTNRLGKLEGVIVTKDIATSYMDVYDNRVLSKARTQYKNIAETLDGNIIAGNEHAYFIRGKVVVGASDLGFYRNTSKRMIWSFSDRRKKCRFVH